MRFMMQSPDGREQRLVSEADTSRVLEAGGSFVKLGDGKPVAVPDETQNGGPPNSELFGHWAKRTAVGAIPAAASTMAQIAASPIAASVGAMTGPAAPVTATGIEAIAAGLGAIPGKFAQQAIEGKPLDMAQALREAQMMGALSVGGKVVGKLVGAGGKGLASASLERAAKVGAEKESVAAAQTAKAAGRPAPAPIDLPQEMVDRRVFSPAAAASKRGEAAARTQAFLDANSAGGPRYRARDLTAEVYKEIKRLRRESTTPGADVAEMKALLRDFLSENRGRLFTAADANKNKQFAGTVAGDKVIGAAAAGKNVTASAPNVKLFNEAIRRGIQKRLEKDLPAVAPLNAETQAYIRLQDAFRHGPGLPAQLAPYAVGSLAGQGFGHPLEGLAAGAATHAIVDPAVQRRLAQLLTSPAMRAMLNLGPKAIPPGLASSLPPASTGWNQ